MNEITTALVVFGTLAGIWLGQRNRNACKHVYETIDYKIIDTYSGDKVEPGVTVRPIRRRTDVTQVCEKCGDPRVKQLEGIWDPENRRPSA